MPRIRHLVCGAYVIASWLVLLEVVTLARPAFADEPFSLRQPVTQQLTPTSRHTLDGIESQLVRYVDFLQPEPDADESAGFLSESLADEDVNDTPAMRGDFTGVNLAELLLGQAGTYAAYSAVAARQLKLSESATALPTDRCYINYNHYHNVFDFTVPYSVSKHLDKYTLGFEKTFFDGQSSVELRMPFTGGLSFAAQTVTADPMAGSTTTIDYGLGMGDVGNLTILLKHILRQQPTWLVMGGLAISLPTGSSVKGGVTNLSEFDTGGGMIDFIESTESFTWKNQAVHLAPYLGFQANPNDCWFMLAFVQIDVDLNGNQVELVEQGRSNVLGSFRNVEVPVIQDQTLLYVDASIGRWCYRNRGGRGITGVAAIGELHYTTAIRDADVLADSLIGPLGNFLNRFDVLNATFGINTQINDNLNVAVAGVAPLRSASNLGENRYFDAEVQVTVEHRY